MSLDDFKKEHPQYMDWDDEVLANALYEKYGESNGVSRDRFMNDIGRTNYITGSAHENRMLDAKHKEEAPEPSPVKQALTSIQNHFNRTIESSYMDEDFVDMPADPEYGAQQVGEPQLVDAARMNTVRTLRPDAPKRTFASAWEEGKKAVVRSTGQTFKVLNDMAIRGAEGRLGPNNPTVIRMKEEAGNDPIVSLASDADYAAKHYTPTGKKHVDFWMDVVQTAPQFAVQGLGTVVGGPAGGVLVMGTQIFGNAYEEAVESGMTHENAMKAAVLRAAGESALEQVGFNRILKNVLGSKNVVRAIAESMATEGGTEYLQSQLGAAINAYVLGQQNGYGSERLTKSMVQAVRDNHRQAKHEGAVGAVMGGGAVSAGSTVRAGVEGAADVATRGLQRNFDLGIAVDPDNTILEQAAKSSLPPQESAPDSPDGTIDPRLLREMERRSLFPDQSDQTGGRRVAPSPRTTEPTPEAAVEEEAPTEAPVDPEDNFDYSDLEFTEEGDDTGGTSADYEDTAILGDQAPARVMERRDAYAMEPMMDTLGVDNDGTVFDRAELTPGEVRIDYASADGINATAMRNIDLIQQAMNKRRADGTRAWRYGWILDALEKMGRNIHISVLNGNTSPLLKAHNEEGTNGAGAFFIFDRAYQGTTLPIGLNEESQWFTGNQRRAQTAVAHELLHALIWSNRASQGPETRRAFEKDLTNVLTDIDPDSVNDLLNDTKFWADTGINPQKVAWINKIFKEAVKDTQQGSTEQIDELITYTMTDPEMAQVFSRIKVKSPGQAPQSLWKKIIEKIARLVHPKPGTVMGEVERIMTEWMDFEVPTVKEIKRRPEQEAPSAPTFKPKTLNKALGEEVIEIVADFEVTEGDFKLINEFLDKATKAHRRQATPGRGAVEGEPDIMIGNTPSDYSRKRFYINKKGKKVRWYTESDITNFEEYAKLANELDALYPGMAQEIDQAIELMEPKNKREMPEGYETTITKDGEIIDHPQGWIEKPQVKSVKPKAKATAKKKAAKAKPKAAAKKAAPKSPKTLKAKPKAKAKAKAAPKPAPKETAPTAPETDVSLPTNVTGKQRQKALGEAYKEQGAGGGNKVVTMTPEEFINLTTATDETANRVRSETTSKAIKEFDLATWKDAPAPYLVIDKDGNVVGHEGRHRAAMYERAGMNEFPVVIIGEDSDVDVKNMDALGSQQFGSKNRMFEMELNIPKKAKPKAKAKAKAKPKATPKPKPAPTPPAEEAPSTKPLAEMSEKEVKDLLAGKHKDIVKHMGDEKWLLNQMTKASTKITKAKVDGKDHSPHQLRYDLLRSALMGKKPQAIQFIARTERDTLDPKFIKDTEALLNKVAPGHDFRLEHYWPKSSGMMPYGYGFHASNPNSPIYRASFTYVGDTIDPAKLKSTVDERVDMFERGKRGETITKIEDFKYEDRKMEQDFQDYRTGVKPETWLARVADFLGSVKNMFREFQHIPRKQLGKFGRATKELRRLRHYRSVAATGAVGRLGRILGNLNKAEYEIFERLVTMADLYEQVEINKQLESNGDEPLDLPFGWEPEAIESEMQRLINVALKNSKVKAAWKARRETWTELKSEYSNAMSEVGFNVQDKMKREFYFRHQVMDYLKAKGPATQGSRKLATPDRRSHLRRRKGSERAINLNYIQAEYEVMAQLLYDIQIANTVATIKHNYDIAPHLRKEQKELENDELQIPEGYVLWRPREGNVMYLADTIPAKLVNDMLKKGLKDMKVKPEDISKVLVIGRKHAEMVIPEELAATLNDYLDRPKKGPVGRFFRSLMTGWKNWQLISPFRVIKYNLRNMTGDAEAIFVGGQMRPVGKEMFTRAGNDIIKALLSKETSQDYKDWIERGGLESNFTSQEMAELLAKPEFSHLTGKGGNIGRFAKAVWKLPRKATDAREHWMRYAAYLAFLKKYKTGTFKRTDYAASIPTEVDSLVDIKDRAFMLSNDLLGAYDRVTHAGNFIRNHVMPFYSFQEVNLSRTVQIYRNMVMNDKLAGSIGRKILGSAGKTSAVLAMQAGRLALTLMFASTVLQVFNNVAYEEEEEALTDELRETPHLYMGPPGSKTIRYFPRIGILGDLLEWANLQSAPLKLADMITGRTTWDDVRKEIKEFEAVDVFTGAGEVTKQFVKKVVGMVGPQYKVPFEMVTKQKLFPDAMNPRPIDSRVAHLMDQMLPREVGNLYRGKPMPKTWKSDFVEGMVTYKQDLTKMAYNATLARKRDFMEKHGFKGRGYHTSEKSMAAYNMALAWRYGDTTAFAKYLAEVIRLNYGKAPNMTRMLEKVNPLAGMTEMQKKLFLGSLTANERKGLQLAFKHYAEIKAGLQFKEGS